MRPVPGEESLPIRTLDYGGRDLEAGVFVARTADQWAALWPHSPPPEPPALDWPAEMVIVVAVGMRPTGGYSVRIEEVRAGAGLIEVRARENAPGPNCFTTQALTYPLHAVAVPARDGEARLNLQVEIVDCQ